MLKRFRSLSLIIVLGSLTLASTADAGLSSTLTAEVGGLRNRNGQLCFSVFSTSQGFPTNGANAVQKKCVKITTSPMKVAFKQLSPGRYAIAVLHDENNDKQANRNFLGLPTEGFGFSRNPTIVAGPPKFTESAVSVAGQNITTQIQLKYLLGQ
ncbi:DUF2141 domain-containing protein [Phormidesmis priestleyi ULC007]|uniref:DUF2141 domain-containing protein n=1 Tax=Phormidesmis priestleyi ULC007 TaxID=1920490 RepID=A0A2T1DFS1_9CYAN|nr:DUF2141 domain-containing protein [Phormidesmis priestleyi]PSB19338.1 DUF2141 domain-containing protein [Phormidesmis priestleyi ULC007]PZO52223.1 MAG: DUF2141 domain-containing protein [Phormidesmis priestleyi]